MNDIEKLRDAVITTGLADLETCEALHRHNLGPIPHDIAQALERETQTHALRVSMLETSIANVVALRALRAATTGNETK